jgi:hypothetical protein
MAIKEIHKNIKSENAIAKPVEPVSQDLRQEIGRGRSGIVYLDHDDSGLDLACKVFDSRGLTKAVQWLTLGAPNPYMWNQDAVECAKIRRNILSLLVPVWMAGEVEVADALAVVWNDAQTTFELRTRFVRGRAASLDHSLRTDQNDEAVNLWRRTMPALRTHLRSAGFDGLLWQAGNGNPVALNNFLLEPVSRESQTAGGEPHKERWIWIDLESGVPAIFPISPSVLFRYSLAHWWLLGRPLFDDVNVSLLENYLQSNQEELRLALGDNAYETIKYQAISLSEHQLRWKSLGRLQSSIQYRLAQGDIDECQATYYSVHQLRWIFSETRRGVRAFTSALYRGLLWIWKRLIRFDFLKIVHNGWRFLSSQKYREEFVHRYLDRGIEHWSKRSQLSDEEVQILRAQIGSPDSSVYVTDFGIHIAIKPAVKGIQYWALPALFAFGLLSGKTVAILIITGGALGRSSYTLWRIFQSIERRSERPWIALVVGVFPVVGNLAFPIQMMSSARDNDENLARFMIDDGFARIGRLLPVWGGEDTWTEHAFNRIPGNFTRYWVQKRKRY